MNTATLATVSAALLSLSGVTLREIDATHVGVYLRGEFLAMAWMEISRGALTGKIVVSRQTGRKLGGTIYGAMKAVAPVVLAD